MASDGMPECLPDCLLHHECLLHQVHIENFELIDARAVRVDETVSPTSTPNTARRTSVWGSVPTAATTAATADPAAAAAAAAAAGDASIREGSPRPAHLHTGSFNARHSASPRRQSFEVTGAGVDLCNGFYSFYVPEDALTAERAALGFGKPLFRNQHGALINWSDTDWTRRHGHPGSSRRASWQRRRRKEHSQADVIRRRAPRQSPLPAVPPAAATPSPIA